MRLTPEQALADPYLLSRIIREWEIFRETVRESPVHFAIYDANDRLIAWNRLYEADHPEAFEIHRAEAEAGTLDYATLLWYQISKSVGPENADAEIERLVATHRASDGEPLVRHYPSSGYMRVYKYRLQSGAVAGLSVPMNDIKDREDALKAAQAEAEATVQELRAANTEIEKIALHDDLTGLPNRQHLQRFFSENKIYPKAGCDTWAILHIGLDRLRQINDTIGYAAGDFVLKHVAEILQSLCRPVDFCARIGGDEFMLILADGTREKAQNLVRDINLAISDPVAFRNHACRISLSVGITITPATRADITMILPEADLALTRAKQIGPAQVAVFDDTMRAEMIAISKMADDIIRSVEEKRFYPVYQPQFSADDLSVVGIETLCRWDHPDGGNLAPGSFLSVAETLSLSKAIDRIIFEKVQKDMEQLAEQALLPPRVSLNLGQDRLLDRQLIDDLKALRQHGLTVVVELLETLSLDTPSDAVLFAIEALKEGGIEIEIDDFGSCRASIVSLISVAPNAMKIDRQIVGPGPESENYRRLIKAAVDIGRALEISVTAEGVETEAHISMARSLGCDVLQGFALARPMSINDLSDFLSGQSRGRAATR